MNIIQNILDLLGRLLSWWFVVLPWEQAVRVRAGNRSKVYEAGLHFKVPFLDYVWIQNIRRRISSVDAQTLSTRDGKTVTLAGSLSYRVTDVMKLQNTLHQAAHTLAQIAAGACSTFIITNDFKDCKPQAIVAAVNEKIADGFERFGLGDVAFFLTDFVTTDRTYRLVQNAVGSQIYGSDLLSTLSDMSNVPSGGVSGAKGR